MLFPHLEHPSTSIQLLPTLSLTLFPLHPCWATSWGLIFTHLSGPSRPKTYSSPNHLHTLILSLIIYFPVLFSMPFIHHLLWANYLPWLGTLFLPPSLPPQLHWVLGILSPQTVEILFDLFITLTLEIHIVAQWLMADRYWTNIY